jgi:hypothetical protein
MCENLEVFIFYFDLVGVTARFISDTDYTLACLRNFHARVRERFPVGGPHSALKTLADNVWARVNTSESVASDVHIMDLATRTMKAAEEYGFDKYFGVITKGLHTFSNEDRILVPNTDPTDILIQHIDMTSEPHIRAVMAEKWSSYLAKKEIYPIPVPSVWVSEEIFEGPIERELFGVDLQCVIRPESFNLNTYESEIGKKWPFDKSRFRAIALR